MELRVARKRARLTQVELGERAGVPQQVISQLETGKVANPAWWTVKRISDALGRRPERLFPVPGRRDDAA